MAAFHGHFSFLSLERLDKMRINLSGESFIFSHPKTFSRIKGPFLDFLVDHSTQQALILLKSLSTVHFAGSEVMSQEERDSEETSWKAAAVVVSHNESTHLF